jgi:hypothetical protein
VEAARRYRRARGVLPSRRGSTQGEADGPTAAERDELRAKWYRHRVVALCAAGSIDARCGADVRARAIDARGDAASRDRLIRAGRPFSAGAGPGVTADVSGGARSTGGGASGITAGLIRSQRISSRSGTTELITTRAAVAVGLAADVANASALAAHRDGSHVTALRPYAAAREANTATQVTAHPVRRRPIAGARVASFVDERRDDFRSVDTAARAVAGHLVSAYRPARLPLATQRLIRCPNGASGRAT